MIPHLMLFDEIGEDSIATFAYNSGLLKDIEISKLKDDVRNANNYLVIEALSVDNPDIKKEYAFSTEYELMYKAIQWNDFKIDINNDEFMFEKMNTNNHFDYIKWDRLTRIIIKI
jgi:hypothetical protein